MHGLYQKIERDLKDLILLEQGKTVINKKKEIDFSKLDFIDGVKSTTSIDYTIDYTENYTEEIDSIFDQILIPASKTINLFDQKEIYISIIYNTNQEVSFLQNFPNLLLFEDSVLCADKVPVKKSKKKIEKQDDIWDILNKLNNENSSESFDNLTETDADIDSDSDTELSSKTNNDLESRICYGCKSKGSFIEDQGSSLLVCSECGIVNEELLDYKPEWRSANNDDGRGEGVNRCGCPSNFFFPKSSQGTIMAGSSNNRLKRKQKWNSMVYKERSLNLVFEGITQVCLKNNLPKIIIDSAKILYKKISDSHHIEGENIGKQIIIRGDNRVSIIAACIFKACEMNKIPRTVKEIAEYFKLETKKVTKGKKQLENIMKTEEENNVILEQIAPYSPEDYIMRYGSKLKLSPDNLKMAIKISNNCCKMKLASDHNTESIAAGSLLLMVNYYNLDIDKKKIAKLFITSDVTISKIYNKIAPYVKALVNDELTNHLIKEFKING